MPRKGTGTVSLIELEDVLIDLALEMEGCRILGVFRADDGK